MGHYKGQQTSAWSARSTRSASDNSASGHFVRPMRTAASINSGKLIKAWACFRFVLPVSTEGVNADSDWAAAKVCRASLNVRVLPSPSPTSPAPSESRLD